MEQAKIQTRRWGRELGGTFLRLWQASAASNLADGIGLTAAPLLAATLSRDPVLVAGLVTAQRLPWFLFSVVSGALVDRLDRKKVLQLGNAIRAAILAIAGIAIWFHRINLVLLYGLYFLLGVVETFFDNAAFAILPRMVAGDQLERANGRLFATQTVANEFVGPPLGSSIFAAFPAAPFFLSAAAFGSSSALVAGLEGDYAPNDREGQVHASLTIAIREGFAWFVRHRLIWALAVLASVYNLSFTAAAAVLVLYAQERLGLPPAAYGLLLAAGALGGVLGGLVAGRLAKWLGKGTTIFLDSFIAGTAITALGFTNSPLAAGALYAAISFVAILGDVVIISLRQKLIPDELLGRVTSVYRLFVLGAVPLGAFLGGLLARSFDLATPFVWGGALLMVTSLVLLPVTNNQRVIEAEREKAATDN